MRERALAVERFRCECQPLEDRRARTAEAGRVWVIGVDDPVEGRNQSLFSRLKLILQQFSDKLSRIHLTPEAPARREGALVCKPRSGGVLKFPDQDAILSC